MSAGKPFESVLLGQHRGEKIYCLERRVPATRCTKTTTTVKAETVLASPSQSSCSTEYMPTPIGTSKGRLDRSLQEAEEKHLKCLINNLEQANGIIHVSSEKTLWLPDSSAETEEVEGVEEELVVATDKDNLNALAARPEGRRSKRAQAGVHKMLVEEILLEELKDSVDVLPAVRSSRRDAWTTEVEEKALEKSAEEKQASAPFKLPVSGFVQNSAPPGTTGSVTGRFRKTPRSPPLVEVPEVPEVLEEDVEDAPRMSEVPEVLDENVEEPHRPASVKLPRLRLQVMPPPGDAATQAAKCKRLVRRTTV